VTQLVVYPATFSDPDMNYKATPLMYDPQGNIRSDFTTYSLGHWLPWDHAITLVCSHMYDGSLPNLSYKTPCHLWPESGWKLGMRITANSRYGGYYQGTQYASKVDIKKK